MSEIFKNLKDDIKKRLESLGYKTFDDRSDWLIDFTIKQVENHIKMVANIEIIPDELYEIEINQICGNFLFSMKNTNQLTDYDFDQIIKQIQEGDINVTFSDVQSAETMFDRLVSKLMIFGENDILNFRCLIW